MGQYITQAISVMKLLTKEGIFYMTGLYFNLVISILLSWCLLSSSGVVCKNISLEKDNTKWTVRLWLFLEVILIYASYKASYNVKDLDYWSVYQALCTYFTLFLILYSVINKVVILITKEKYLSKCGNRRYITNIGSLFVATLIFSLAIFSLYLRIPLLHIYNDKKHEIHNLLADMIGI